MAELRAARSADLESVLALNNEAVPAVNELDVPSLERLAADAAALVVAETDAGLAGFLMLLSGPGLDYESPNYSWFSARYDSFLYVDRVVVAPGAKRRGLGRRFYEHAISLGSGRFPFLCAEVNTRPRNDESLAFHESLGFAAVGSQDTEGGAKTVRMLTRALGGRADG